MIEERDYPLTLERSSDAGAAPTNVPRKTLIEHEQDVISSAVAFIACDFMGSARYRVSEHKTTRELAIVEAHKLIDTRDDNIYSKHRPVLIYAWNGTYQTQCDLVYPKGKTNGPRLSKHAQDERGTSQ